MNVPLIWVEVRHIMVQYLMWAIFWVVPEDISGSIIIKHLHDLSLEVIEQMEKEDREHAEYKNN